MSDLPDKETLRYSCSCHEDEGNDFSGPAYCKRPEGCTNPATPAFDAEWWFEREETLGRRLKAVVTTYRIGDLSVSTRVEFE